MRRPEQLTEDQRSTITHALRVAAEQYERNIFALREDPKPGHDRLWKQFERQAIDARKLADDLDNALEVVVTYD